ncbi:MAG: ferrous iron transport protein A [Clostridia bacterium]|nr:ferrous iron transport protein A [Clostridia bacterium]
MAEKGVFPLCGLKSGDAGIIKAVTAEGELRRRLTELGYFPGERVKKVLVSPLGDPCAYLVRGTVTAIRRRDAESILIREAGEWD